MAASEVDENGASREWWTDDGTRLGVIDFDQYGIAQITREALHDLLERAGFTQTQPPPTDLPPTDGRARLREAAQVIPPAKRAACCGLHVTPDPSGHCDWTCCEHDIPPGNLMSDDHQADT